MAPIISADSRPSLNIIENEVEKAMLGATMPVPDTRRSDFIQTTFNFRCLFKNLIIFSIALY